MTLNEIRARELMVHWAWVAENMAVLDFPVPEIDDGYYKRLARICITCLWGPEWLKFREMSPQGQVQYVRTWWDQARIPARVINQFDAAVRKFDQITAEKRG